MAQRHFTRQEVADYWNEYWGKLPGYQLESVRLLTE